VSQLTIDAGVGVYGLRVIGNTVVVVGGWETIAWNLSAGDFVPDAIVELKVSDRRINHQGNVIGATISPDSRYVALVVEGHDSNYLHIYSASTGEDIWGSYTQGHSPRFSPDGCDVWSALRNGKAEVWGVCDWGNTLKRPGTVDIEHPPEGYPWGSSRGYRVTEDWWILCPDGKRLLMLTPRWRSYALYRVWKGQFLALLHGGLSEPVILELESNVDSRL